jgi:hypothetical protein
MHRIGNTVGQVDGGERFGGISIGTEGSIRGGDALRFAPAAMGILCARPSANERGVWGCLSADHVSPTYQLRVSYKARNTHDGDIVGRLSGVCLGPKAQVPSIAAEVPTAAAAVDDYHLVFVAALEGLLVSSTARMAERE